MYATALYRIQDDAATEAEECKHPRSHNIQVHEPRDLVLDAGCGTIGNGQACLLMQLCRRILGSARNTNCVDDARPTLAETFATHLLKNDSDVTTSEDVPSAVKTQVDTLYGISTKQ